MSSAADLKIRTVKELAEMARKQKVLGWHDMRKDELVMALVRQAKKAAAKRNGTNRANGVVSKNGQSKNGHSKNGHAKNGTVAVIAKVESSNGHSKVVASAPLETAEKQALLEQKKLIEKGPKPRSPHAERRLQQIKARLAEAKDLAFHALEQEHNVAKDRLVVMVRDPYWLHAYWELSRRSIQRAEVAMGQHWHAARPVLRLHEVSRNGTTSAARQAVRDIEIHGGVNNWYIDVQNPPKSYQVEIGYLAPGNRFYCLGRSNVVSTPMPGSADTFDRNWAEVAKECDRVYAITAGSNEQEANGDLKDVFEEQMHRPMGDSLIAQFGPGAAASKHNFRFQVDTELIVHGVTHPDARVTLRGEPVRLRPDGSFAVRFSLPDRRHVLPVVANSGDGAEQRTIVLAIDRNTKVMEPVVRDPGE
ncbi:MAG: DUF4912 domain-containing protein [Thermoguttaceae bacterium]